MHEHGDVFLMINYGVNVARSPEAGAVAAGATFSVGFGRSVCTSLGLRFDRLGPGRHVGAGAARFPRRNPQLLPDGQLRRIEVAVLVHDRRRRRLELVCDLAQRVALLDRVEVAMRARRFRRRRGRQHRGMDRGGDWLRTDVPGVASSEVDSAFATSVLLAAGNDQLLAGVEDIALNVVRFLQLRDGDVMRLRDLLIGVGDLHRVGSLRLDVRGGGRHGCRRHMDRTRSNGR